MTNNSSSTMEVPQAKDAMDKFKMEVASEIGVNLKQGYNGDLTSVRQEQERCRIWILCQCFFRF